MIVGVSSIKGHDTACNRVLSVVAILGSEGDARSEGGGSPLSSADIADHHDTDTPKPGASGKKKSIKKKRLMKKMSITFTDCAKQSIGIAFKTRLLPAAVRRQSADQMLKPCTHCLFTDESLPIGCFIPAETLVPNVTAGDTGTAGGTLNQPVLGFLVG